MFRFYSFLSIFFVSLLLTHQSIAHTKLEAERGKPLRLVMGGFLSCSYDNVWYESTPKKKLIYQTVENWRIEENRDETIIYTCYSWFDVYSVVTGLPLWINYLTMPQDPDAVIWTSLDKMIDVINALNPSDIRIFGHSYGGYSALVLAHQLTRNKIKVDGVFVADGIHARNCTPVGFTGAYLEHFLDWLMNNISHKEKSLENWLAHVYSQGVQPLDYEPCMGSMTIDGTYMKYLAKNIPIIINTYQETDLFLRGGMLKHARNYPPFNDTTFGENPIDYVMTSSHRRMIYNPFHLRILKQFLFPHSD